MTDPTDEDDELELLRERAKIIRAAAPKSGSITPLEETACCIEWGVAEIERLRALTAAAQVRERAGRGGDNRIASPAQETALAGYVESVARALHEAHKPYCDYVYAFEDPMSSADMYRALARAVTLVRGPALMPIYGASEPQVPDVLGTRKGEE